MFPALFNPKSIAIIGASTNPDKIGSQILANVIKSEYPGDIYPINKSETKLIQGLQSFPSLNEVPEDIDLIIVAVPASAVESVIDDAIKKSVKAAIIISAGFKEIDTLGAAMEQRIAQKCAQAKIQLLGPNCLGLINNPSKLNASFAHHAPNNGNITFISQSGAFGTAAIDWADSHHLGFDTFISLGNKAGLSENDFLREFLHPKQSLPKVIAMYLEDFKDGHLFVHLSYEITKRVPIVLLKPGRSQQAKNAIQSHTGSLATDDSIVSSACEKAGILRVDTSEQLFQLMQTFSLSQQLKGNRIAIITNAGGPGILATDHLSMHGLSLAPLSANSQSELSSLLPRAANIHDPIDVLGDAKADRYFHALKVTIREPQVDGILVVLTPQTSTEIVRTAQTLTQIQSITDKPILAAFLGGNLVNEGINYLNQHQIAAFAYPEQAIYCLGKMFLYHQYQNRNQLSPLPLPLGLAPKISAPTTPSQLPLTQASQLLKETGIISAPFEFADSINSAQAIAHKLGFPIVMKAISPKVLHKTESHAVYTNVDSIDEVQRVYRQLQTITDSNSSILLQKQISGIELFLGMKRDPQFGPIVLFGTGGIYTEIFHDIAQCIAPLTRNEALKMINSTLMGKILAGARGREPFDLHRLAVIICQIGTLALSNTRIKEIDLNPVMITEDDQIIAVDQKIIVS